MRYLSIIGAFTWPAAAVPFIQERAPTPQLGVNLIEGITTISDGPVPSANTTSHQRRAQIQQDCSNQQSFIDNTLSQCASTARKAQQAAQDSGSPLVRLFFKNDDQTTRSRVADLFGKIAEECGANGAGYTHITRYDDRGQCNTYWAWTDIENGGARVLLCQPFFQAQNNGKANCGTLDSGGVMLHEMTHALGETGDFKNSYGLQAVQRLSASDNIRHADTYAIFANAAALNCNEQDLQTGGPPTGSPPPDSNEIPGSQPPFQGDGPTRPPGSPDGSPQRPPNDDFGQNGQPGLWPPGPLDNALGGPEGWPPGFPISGPPGPPPNGDQNGIPGLQPFREGPNGPDFLQGLYARGPNRP